MPSVGGIDLVRVDVLVAVLVDDQVEVSYDGQELAHAGGRYRSVGCGQIPRNPP